MLLSHPTSSSNVQLQPQHSKDGTSKEKLRDTNDSHSDRKYNLVIFGIKESPTGTQRSDRLKADFDSSLSVLSKANKRINVQSIRDFFHLGKYKRDAIRPRPILVKLNRAMDVTDALSNRSSLPEGATIKPDMSQEERKTESILLSQRWSLIQSGVNKKDI